MSIVYVVLLLVAQYPKRLEAFPHLLGTQASRPHYMIILQVDNRSLTVVKAA
jgi:hypothetical protein